MTACERSDSEKQRQLGHRGGSGAATAAAAAAAAAAAVADECAGGGAPGADGPGDREPRRCRAPAAGARRGQRFPALTGAPVHARRPLFVSRAPLRAACVQQLASSPFILPRHQQRAVAAAWVRRGLPFPRRGALRAADAPAVSRGTGWCGAGCGESTSEWDARRTAPVARRPARRASACMTTARLCGLLRRDVLPQRGTELSAAPPVAAPEAAARCVRLQAIAVAAAMLSAAGAAVLFRRRAECATAPRASRRGRAGFDKLGCASRGWPVCAAGLPAQRLAARGAPARRILDWRPRLP